MTKLVIFDCDGVLVDSESITLRVIADSLIKHGLPVAPVDIPQMFMGETMHDVSRRAKAMGANLPPDWIEATYDTIFDALRNGVRVIDGVLPLLDKLDAAGIAIAIASNGPMEKMAITLPPSGLWDRFSGRIYSAHDHIGKPSPDMLLKACAQAGVGVHDAVMIDDSTAGCQSAQAAPMRCFGLDEHGDGAHLAAVGAIPVRHVDEITKALRL